MVLAIESDDGGNGDIGNVMYEWVRDLFPIARSITGPGVRETLRYFQTLIPRLEVHSVPTGYKAFDWIVPEEWVIRSGHISDAAGNKIVDFANNTLHVVGYSVPVDVRLGLDDLQTHLYSLPESPTAIPYVTSYYERRWGFCIAHEQRQSLRRGTYHVVIDADLKHGELNYGEVIIPGECEKEVLLSTYICHPSMANNELSGPVVTAAIAQWLEGLPKRKYTYRIVYVPETIGSIVYLSKNLSRLKANVIAGFNVSCVGDDRCYSYLPSRNGSTLSDQVALHVLKFTDKNFHRYSWLDRGSDERQYCAPGIDLPIASIMRSKFAEYPEYHTSLDNMSVVSPEGLTGALNALRRAVSILENNGTFKASVLCEPHLGTRGLYPTLSTVQSRAKVRTMMNLLSYCDGFNSLLEVCDKIDQPFWETESIVADLLAAGLIEDVS